MSKDFEEILKISKLNNLINSSASLQVMDMSNYFSLTKYLEKAKSIVEFSALIYSFDIESNNQINVSVLRTNNLEIEVSIT